jgi:hemerythrin
VAFVIWNPAWETGNRPIDDEHRELLAQIEQLFTAIHENRPGERLVEILSFLSQYVGSHFANEERQMERSHYPGLVQHKGIHDDMRIQVANLIETSHRDPEVVTEDVVNFLTEWLVGHIAEEDQRMARHLLWFEARGVET